MVDLLKMLNYQQKKSICILFFLFVVLFLLFYSIFLFQNYLIALNNYQEIISKENMLKNNSLLREKITVNKIDATMDLERMKNLAEKYNLLLIDSELNSDPEKVKEFRLQFKGNYRDFLRFLGFYCLTKFSYRLAELNIVKGQNIIFEMRLIL